MNDLIIVLDNEPRVSHKVIAENTSNKVQSIQDLITKNLPDFEEFGTMEVEILNVKNSAGASNQQKTYFLNEYQATLLMTYLRNSEIVKKFKISLVKEFYKLKENHRKSLENNKAHITGGYKSQLSQKNSKIKALETQLLMLDCSLDAEIDYRLRAKALYPIILNRFDLLDEKLHDRFLSLPYLEEYLNDIKQLLAVEARKCKYITILGNGTAVNNFVIEDSNKKLTFK
jgi:phage regulator Rha-like protein